MKIIALLVVFIGISEARPNERVEETIKSRLAELGSFEKDTEEIVGNFNKEILANNVQLEKEILEIKNNGRLQLDHIYQNIKVEKNQKISDVQEILNRADNTQKNIPRIYGQMYDLYNDTTKRVMDFDKKIEENVAQLNYKIQKSVEKQFAKGESLSQDVEKKVKSLIDGNQFEVDSFHKNIQSLVNRRHERSDRQIRTVKERVNDYNKKIKVASSIYLEALLVSSQSKFIQIIKDLDTQVREAINDLNEKSLQVENTFLDEVCNSSKEIDSVNQLMKKIEANVKKLKKELLEAIQNSLNDYKYPSDFGVPHPMAHVQAIESTTESSSNSSITSGAGSSNVCLILLCIISTATLKEFLSKIYGGRL